MLRWTRTRLCPTAPARRLVEQHRSTCQIAGGGGALFPSCSAAGALRSGQCTPHLPLRCRQHPSALGESSAKFGPFLWWLWRGRLPLVEPTTELQPMPEIPSFRWISQMCRPVFVHMGRYRLRAEQVAPEKYYVFVLAITVLM